jgi:hypothetical protein
LVAKGIYFPDTDANGAYLLNMEKPFKVNEVLEMLKRDPNIEQFRNDWFKDKLEIEYGDEILTMENFYDLVKEYFKYKRVPLPRREVFEDYHVNVVGLTKVEDRDIRDHILELNAMGIIPNDTPEYPAIVKGEAPKDYVFSIINRAIFNELRLDNKPEFTVDVTDSQRLEMYSRLAGWKWGKAEIITNGTNKSFIAEHGEKKAKWFAKYTKEFVENYYSGKDVKSYFTPEMYKQVKGKLIKPEFITDSSMIYQQGDIVRVRGTLKFTVDSDQKELVEYHTAPNTNYAIDLDIAMSKKVSSDKGITKEYTIDSIDKLSRLLYTDNKYGSITEKEFNEMFNAYRGEKVQSLPNGYVSMSYLKEAMYDDEFMELVEPIRKFDKNYVKNNKYREYTYMDKYKMGKTDFSKTNPHNFPPDMVAHYIHDFREAADLLKTDKKSSTSLFNQFLWRPDIEYDMINAINERRMERGMNPLEVSNTLMDISRFASKRDFFSRQGNTRGINFISVGIDQGEKFKEKFIVDAELSHCTDWNTSGFSHWIPGKTGTPFQYAYFEKDFENIYEVLASRKLQLYVDLTKYLEDLFGYSKSTSLVNDATILYTNADDILNYWEEIEVLQFEHHVPGAPDSIHEPLNIIDVIYNPNAKTIGVGSIYYRPDYNGALNGLTGIYVMVSE